MSFRVSENLFEIISPMSVRGAGGRVNWSVSRAEARPENSRIESKLIRMRSGRASLVPTRGEPDGVAREIECARIKETQNLLPRIGCRLSGADSMSAD